jgi:predicted nucleotidyltransferase
MREMEIEQLRRRLSGRREIKFAMLYGSAAEGNDYNDLDVALYVDPALISGLDELLYGFRLEDELRQFVAHPVDVRIVNRAPAAFKFNVIKGIPLVIADEAAYYDFRERSWAEYLNLEPLHRAYFAEML